MSFETVKQALSRPEDIKVVDVAPTSVPVYHVQLNHKKCPGFCLVPPHPQLMGALRNDYRKEGEGQSFFAWAKENSRQVICPTTGHNAERLAKSKQASFNTGLARVSIPQHRITGDVYLSVILIKFPGEEPQPEHTQGYFEELLFSKNILPSGSIADYFDEVTQGQISINGFVSDWITVPNPKSYYTAGKYALSGSYPTNGQGLAEDAIQAAKDQGVVFPSELDFKRIGTVGALCIFNTGRGAEQTGNPNDIWSHKGELGTPVKVGDDLSVRNYMFVPEDAQIGLFCHELGHLAFEWDDFYDANSDMDGIAWDGSGNWDLMAGGNWNSTDGVQGSLPAPPAALHRAQHGWIQMNQISQTTFGVTLPPQNSSEAQAIRLRSKAFKPTQSLILENRSTTVGTRFDKGLPGGGLLVWKVDTDQYQTSPQNPGMLLVEADKNGGLLRKEDVDSGERWDGGSAGDPFPGSTGNSTLDDSDPDANTSFPNGNKSGITLVNITRDVDTEYITLDIIFS